MGVQSTDFTTVSETAGLPAPCHLGSRDANWPRDGSATGAWHCHTRVASGELSPQSWHSLLWAAHR